MVCRAARHHPRCQVERPLTFGPAEAALSQRLRQPQLQRTVDAALSGNSVVVVSKEMGVVAGAMLTDGERWYEHMYIRAHTIRQVLVGT